MLAAGSPDARFVSPWLGGHTPYSGRSPSPWDHTAPSPVSIPASSMSRKASVTGQRRRSHQLNFTADGTHSQIRKDGTRMTLSQSKKLSQMTADNDKATRPQVGLFMH
ncbi:pre-mRNA-splicing factor ATP-dependent RNA helicase DEAH7-like [Aristolochia californica]|uniref:pre-mRNA-splicing factor ATP-dependent RNA helicase DEAH7-like n=1 Tax=Aristolochia californica TaxID=171875 RepID=UPI0035D54670